MDMSEVKHPASNLRIARAWSGLTVDQILERTGLARASYYRLEKRGVVDTDVAAKLADALGVSKEFLVGWRPTSEEFAELEGRVA